MSETRKKYELEVKVEIGGTGVIFVFDNLSIASHFADLAIRTLDLNNEEGINKIWIEVEKYEDR